MLAFWYERGIGEEQAHELVQRGVGFASAAAHAAEQVHLFNFDRGTVWWDDVVIRL